MALNSQAVKGSPAVVVALHERFGCLACASPCFGLLVSAIRYALGLIKMHQSLGALNTAGILFLDDVIQCHI